MSNENPQSDPRFIKTVFAVAASFFGVRSSKQHEADIAQLKPLHVVLVGVAMAALFVLSLVLIVRMIAA